MVPAVVRTVEETGCACITGVPGVSAFLPLDAYTAAFGPATKPVPGQIVQAVVSKQLRGGASVVLDCGPAAVGAATTQEFPGVTLRSLLPGQHVTVWSQAHIYMSITHHVNGCSALLHGCQGRASSKTATHHQLL
jgi:hypothetical protein